MSVEGKVANRTAIKRQKLSNKTTCERCQKEIDVPTDVTTTANGVTLYLKSYVGTENFVYESRSGNAVCYCSAYCAKKHNHRFK